ncbi:conserved hypothetical protein [Vibrio crassostreae]|nr:conserved hypothetical protein [Vibrio chagasii]CAK2091083.1 conserved hypothetical protein [Vibrio crassostreae]CAK2965464.1 conserved hypothetical protein [Vibrio crassostreae]CAK3068565.1 conserved hypothetical protein [Vibrio crassostreae]CAK3515058.1 conserved hypothetical protein [Vibrio crassostreae]
MSCLAVLEVKSEVGSMTSPRIHRAFKINMYYIGNTHSIHFIDQLNEISIIDLVSV